MEESSSSGSEQQKLTAQFNESISQIMRMNELWQSCNRFSSSGQLLKWKWTLDAIWRELSPDAFRLDKQIEESNKKWTYIIKISANEVIAKAKNNDMLYLALNEKEEALRQLLNDAGKGTILRDTYEDEIQ